MILQWLRQVKANRFGFSFSTRNEHPNICIRITRNKLLPLYFVWYIFWQSIWHSFWHFIWHIFWHFYLASVILSDMLFDIFSHILVGILSDIYSDISIWHSIWHFMWHIFSYSMWHFIWHIFWNSKWHSFWHMSYVPVHGYPAVSGASDRVRVPHSIGSWRYRVQVHACPTASGACNMVFGSGPSNAHRKQGAEEGRGRKELHFLLKSGDPHFVKI